jgi:hypothetical protein
VLTDVEQRYAPITAYARFTAEGGGRREIHVVVGPRAPGFLPEPNPRVRSSARNRFTGAKRRCRRESLAAAPTSLSSLSLLSLYFFSAHHCLGRNGPRFYRGKGGVRHGVRSRGSALRAARNMATPVERLSAGQGLRGVRFWRGRFAGDIGGRFGAPAATDSTLESRPHSGLRCEVGAALAERMKTESAARS